jgi:hypothetical protein
MLSELYVAEPDWPAFGVPGLPFSCALGLDPPAESRPCEAKLLLLCVPGLLESGERFDPA